MIYIQFINNRDMIKAIASETRVPTIGTTSLKFTLKDFRTGEYHDNLTKYFMSRLNVLNINNIYHITVSDKYNDYVSIGFPRYKEYLRYTDMNEIRLLSIGCNTYEEFGIKLLKDIENQCSNLIDRTHFRSIII